MRNKQLEMMPREHDMTAYDTKFAKKVAEAVADGAVTGYKKIEKAVISGYKKIETGAVAGFAKVVNKCVEVLFAKEGESVEDAKKRLSHKEEK